ncbi:MAG: glutaredoxin [Acidobacteria bacterium]|nr:glutaredoxin [Acidobacteriota bacterium]
MSSVKIAAWRVVMSNVIIYTKTGCPYCAKARGWYTAEGIEFEERNAQENKVYRQEMLAYTRNDPTVPVIVVDGRLKQIGWEGRG